MSPAWVVCTIATIYVLVACSIMYVDWRWIMISHWLLQLLALMCGQCGALGGIPQLMMCHWRQEGCDQSDQNLSHPDVGQNEIKRSAGAVTLRASSKESRTPRAVVKPPGIGHLM